MQTLAKSVQFAPKQTTINYKIAQSLKIIALGDSLIYGYGDHAGGGWVERLRRLCMSHPQDHVIYNLGIRGDRVAQVTQRLEQEFSKRGETRNRYPDLIILSVGVNDSARLKRPDGKLFTELSLFQQHLTELLIQSQQLCPVLFVGMVPVDETKMPFLDCLYYNHRDQYTYKEATKIACSQHNIPYLDIFDLWQQRGESWCCDRLTNDGLHPNVLGYEALLQDVLAWQPLKQLIAT